MFMSVILKICLVLHFPVVLFFSGEAFQKGWPLNLAPFGLLRSFHNTCWVYGGF